MAAGNAMSVTNGVTGIEIQAQIFRDSGLIGNSRVSVFHQRSPVTSFRRVSDRHFLFPAFTLYRIRRHFINTF